jgi:hypothetical protein
MSEQWAYASDRLSETYSGPFGSREEAIREGFAAYPDADSIVVARAEYPDPGSIAARCLDAEDLMERMEEQSDNDEWCNNDDALFHPMPGTDSKEAETALAATLSEWAKKYIARPTFFTARDPETVERGAIARRAG